MSLIKAIKQQLGLSVTPANNFTLDASANNGTMKLARNSGQDIMTVDAAGKVAFPQGAIVDSGSNANGYYTKFDDGTLIQRGSLSTSIAISTPMVGGFRANASVVTLPVDFISADFSVVVSNAEVSAMSAFDVAGNRTVSSISITFTAVTTQTSAARVCTWVAIGRWK